MDLFRIFGLLFLLVFGSLFFGCDQIHEPDAVYGIIYGDSFYDSDNIFFDDVVGEEIPFIWMFYVVKFQDKVILIDTGFQDNDLAEKYGVTLRDSLSLLLEIGVISSDVTDVVITHSHFDHVSRIKDFEQAAVYMQRNEFEVMKNKEKNAELVAFLEQKSNLVLFDDTFKLYDLITVNKVGGHSIGSSVASFTSDGVDYVFVGDECYLLENCKGKLIGTYYDIGKNRDFVSSVREKKVLPSHDPYLREIYTQLNINILQII